MLAVDVPGGFFEASTRGTTTEEKHAPPRPGNQSGRYFLSRSVRYSSYPLSVISSFGMKWRAADWMA